MDKNKFGTVWVRKDLKRALKIECARAERTMEDCLSEAVEEWLKRRGVLPRSKQQ